jgi:hypothetical protein
MRAATAAAGIAKVLDASTLIGESTALNIISAYLIGLDKPSAPRKPPGELVVAAARALARLTVSDRGDQTSEVSLAWDWRASLSQLSGSGYAQELLYKAWYAVNAMQRITSSSDPTEAFRRERRYHAQHLDAQEQRSRQRQIRDVLSEIYGKTLCWYSVLDEGTTPECREAHGKNFDVDVPPAIGYPGTVHGKCRCTAGPPHQNAEMVG